MFGRVLGRVGVVGVLVGLAVGGLGAMGCSQATDAQTSDDQEVVASHDVGTDWIKKVRTTLDGITAKSQAVKDASLKLGFSDPTTQAARDQSAALTKQITSTLKDLTRVLDDLDATLDDGAVLGKAHGTVSVPDESETNAAGQKVVGLRPVRGEVSSAAELVDSGILPLVAQLANPSLEARGQLAFAFRDKVDALTAAVDGLRKDIDTWTPSTNAPQTWKDPDGLEWLVASSQAITWGDANRKCRGLASRLPTVVEIGHVRGLIPASLEGIDLHGSYWASDLGDVDNALGADLGVLSSYFVRQTADTDPQGRPMKALCVK